MKSFPRHSAAALSILCVLPASTWAFTTSSPLPTRALVQPYLPKSSRLYFSSSSSSSSTSQEQDLDQLLSDDNESGGLRQAARFVRNHPELELSREQWNKIFDKIEQVTSEAEEESINLRRQADAAVSSLLSKSRVDMTDMYRSLQERGHLRLFGCIGKENWPASGSRTVLPSMLEQIGLLSMNSLTPKPSNTLLYAGVVVAILEGFASIALGIDLNFLTFLTIVAVVGDRAFLNGAISEGLVKVLKPETQPKITRHEAGHFLCAYLLGCPVEGYVLSAWAALQDARFGTRGVSAGTSFFDPALSEEINSSQVKRSSIDRYSIVVMAGIAAEAINYGRADGGAGDEMALIAFLSNLDGGTNNVWDDVSIRNQARWGALQAILMLREYRECYDALVDALERGGSLGDCIHAIEKAGRDYNKDMSPGPKGYILEKSGGAGEEWVTELPAVVEEGAQSPPTKSTSNEDPETSLRRLREIAEAKLLDINRQLDNL